MNYKTKLDNAINSLERAIAFHQLPRNSIPGDLLLAANALLELSSEAVDRLRGSEQSWSEMETDLEIAGQKECELNQQLGDLKVIHQRLVRAAVEVLKTAVPIGGSGVGHHIHMVDTQILESLSRTLESEVKR